MTIKEFKIKVDCINIAVKRYGDPSKPSLVAFHGWLDNANSFDLLAQHLTNYCLYAIDLPGHGLSDNNPAGYSYSFLQSCTQLIKLIQQLPLKHPHLLGHSLGACLASIIAGSIPNLINKLILLDGLGPLTHKEDEAAYHYQRYLNALSRLPSKKTRYHDSLLSAATIRAKNSDLDIKLALLLAQRGCKKTPDGYYWSHDKALQLPSANRMTEPQVLSFLNKVTAPTLFLSAEQGYNFDQQAMIQRMASIKKLNHHRLACGHHLHMEDPKSCAALISTFIG